MWRVNILQIAAAAIALHAIQRQKKEFINKINFQSNPLAYLLFLVDNLQEWNRSLRPSDWPSYTLNAFTTEHDTITLDYNVYHEQWTPAMRKKVKKFLIEKKNIMKLAIGPNPPVALKIIMQFSPNPDDTSNEPITVRL